MEVLVEHSEEFIVVLVRPFLRKTFYVNYCVRLFLNEMFHLTSAQTLDDDAHLVCARHLDHLDEFGEDAYRVKVFFVGQFCVFILLAEYAECGVWFLFQHPDEIQTFLSAHNDRGHVGRENYNISHAEGRVQAFFLVFDQGFRVALVICNHLYSGTCSSIIHFFVMISIFRAKVLIFYEISWKMIDYLIIKLLFLYISTRFYRCK